MDQVDVLLADVLSLKTEVEHLHDDVDQSMMQLQILDSLTLTLIQENDRLRQEVDWKNQCILALNATVQELQRAVSGKDRR